METSDYKSMFPSLSEEEIINIVEEYKNDDDKLFDALSKLNTEKDESLGVDPTFRKRFPALTLDEIKVASKKIHNRDALISKLTEMENEKKKNIHSEMKDLTMSVIGDVLTLSEGDYQQTIKFLTNIQEEKKHNFIPIKQMDEDTRTKYEDEGIKNRANDIVEEVKQRKEKTLIKTDKKKENVEEDEENLKRIKQLEFEQGICILTIEYSVSQGYVNVVWQFNNKYQFNGNEWIGLYKESATTNDYIKYVKVKNMERGSYQFKLPTEDGFYHVRLVDNNNTLVTSNTLHVGPKINFHAELKEEEKKILLHFVVESGNLSANEWVSFTRKDKPHRKYISCHYLNLYARDGKSGTIEVNMPRRPLEYEFRYFPASNGYSPLKISNTIKVPKHDKLTLEYVRNSPTDLKAIVHYDIHAVDVSKWDYIALYKEGDTKIISSQYVDPQKKSLTFDIPRLPNNYVFKYWASGIRSAPLDISDPVVVENKDKLYAEYADDAISVKWEIYSVDTSSSDWVAIVKVGKTNREYFSYEYIRTCANHIVLTKIPKESGTYEVRYFSHTKSKYDHLVASNPIVIP